MVRTDGALGDARELRRIYLFSRHFVNKARDLSVVLLPEGRLFLNDCGRQALPGSAAKIIVRRSARSAAASTIATSGFRLMYTATCVGVSRVRANVHRKKPSAPPKTPKNTSN